MNEPKIAEMKLQVIVVKRRLMMGALVDKISEIEKQERVKALYQFNSNNKFNSGTCKAAI